MELDGRRPLLWETGARWLTEKIKEDRVPILSAVIVGLLAYMFTLTNKLVNHDDVFTLFFKGGTFSLGRWGLSVLDCIFPNYSMPWIYGVLSIGLMTAAVCVLIHVFRIRNKLLQALLAGCILAFPSLTATMAYMFTVSSYALSFLLAVTAVWLVQRPSKKYFLPAVVCMILSLSIYQSYIAVAASALVLILIQRLLYEEDPLPIVKTGLLFLGFLILSLGLYYIATVVINRILGVGLNGYADGNFSFSLTALPTDIADAYRAFFLYFRDGLAGLMPTGFSRMVHLLCLAAIVVLFLVWGRSLERKSAGRLVLLVLLVAILPLAINCMHLFATADAVHTLVLYSFIAVYILAAILADACLPLALPGKLPALCGRAALHALTLGMAVVIVCNVYLANEVALNLYLRYENAYSFYTALVADIQMTPDFDENTRLAVIGDYASPAFYYDHFYFTDADTGLTGTAGFLPSTYSKEQFLEYYLGFSISFASEEEIAQIETSAAYAEMAVYPYYGSIQMIGDILVVKLS